MNAHIDMQTHTQTLTFTRRTHTFTHTIHTNASSKQSIQQSDYFWAPIEVSQSKYGIFYTKTK